MYIISFGDPNIRIYQLAVLLTWLLAVASGELLIFNNNENPSSLKRLHNGAFVEGGLLQDPIRKPSGFRLQNEFANRLKRALSRTDSLDNDSMKEANLASDEKLTGNQKHRVRRAPCFGMYGGGGGAGGGGGGGRPAAGGTGAGTAAGGGGGISTGVGDADFNTGGVATARRRLARRMSRRASRKSGRKKFVSDSDKASPPEPERRKRQAEQADFKSEKNSVMDTITGYYRQFGDKIQSAWNSFASKVSDLTSSMTDRFA